MNSILVADERHDGIVQVLQNISDSKYVTISIDIILRVYEEAKLYTES